MSTADKVRIFLAKLRDLPEQKKKIILWTIVAITALIMVIFWVRGAMDNLSKIGTEIQSEKLPEFKMPEVPSLDILQTATPTNN